MTVSSERRTVTVALIGNPNTGKSTLFGGLVGVRQRVGNYPGVTVEKKVGRVKIKDHSFSIVDLPGTYSLAARSPDEMVALDVLLGRLQDTPPVDVVLCIADASNLERNLYLVSQVLELDAPVVLALNMSDVAAANGTAIDVDLLQRRLGVPVVRTQANRRVGLAELKEALFEAAGAAAPRRKPSLFPEAFCREVQWLRERAAPGGLSPSPFLLERLLLDAGGYLATALKPTLADGLMSDVVSARRRLADQGLRVPGVETEIRYAWVAETLEGVATRPSLRRSSVSDRLDRVLTHRLWGTLIFLVVISAVFQAVFYVAEPASAAIDGLKTMAGSAVEQMLAEGAFRSLIVEGVIEGVGGVLVFLPQIFILFLFLALLEDCGYMARSAYLMDRLMAGVGLNGKSFIPLLSSFACAIPGIMAARVIENRRDRLATILVAPLMSCSARLPVYALFAGAFVPDYRWLGRLLGLQGLVVLSMYLLGILTAVVAAMVLKRTLLRDSPQPFVMELPGYKIPDAGVVLHRMLERGGAFIRQAGTLIVAVSILVWAAAYFPRRPQAPGDALLQRQAALRRQIQRAETPGVLAVAGDPLSQAQADLARVDNEIAGAYLRDSYLGGAGRWIQPCVEPLGWDWKIGCAVLASFPAREVVVATLGVLFNLGEAAAKDSHSLGQTLRDAKREGTDTPVFTTPVALSIMVFFALCAQCASTLAVMKRETNSWRWPLLAFGYMTTLAYLGALATYQLGQYLASHWS